MLSNSQRHHYKVLLQYLGRELQSCMNLPIAEDQSGLLANIHVAKEQAMEVIRRLDRIASEIKREPPPDPVITITDPNIRWDDCDCKDYA